VSADAARIRPRRRIDGAAAVFLPFDAAGRPDLGEFTRHLLRTAAAGLTPAVNMDTGFGPQLAPAERRAVLRAAREALGPGARLIAGAQPFGEAGGALPGYRASVEAIVAAGAVPIVFPSELFAGAGPERVAALHREILAPAPAGLAFELGPQFAPFGRIYDLATFRALLEVPALVGLKHSSLSRRLELERLACRDRDRPAFAVYTGNDLAIDMVMYGSDYLLGLATFAPEAFALRDRWWAEGDPRFHELNDALQALGAAAFREPVPAYKDSAAVYLRMTGALADPRPHPACPRRPAWEAELLAPLARRIAAAAGAAPWDAGG